MYQLRRSLKKKAPIYIITCPSALKFLIFYNKMELFCVLNYRLQLDAFLYNSYNRKFIFQMKMSASTDLVTCSRTAPTL